MDSQSAERVSFQLILLVKQLLRAGDAAPDPFPRDVQLSDLGISSLKMVNLMLAVEMEFDVAIPAADITPENFHSVAAMTALVTRILGIREPA